MSQQQMKNAGYQKIRRALEIKCLSEERKNRAFGAYNDQLAKHDEVSATLVHLLAGSVIENA